MKQEGLSSKAKIGILFLILVVGFTLAILWSLVKVSMIDGDTWRKRAEKFTKNYIEKKAQRGNIYSSDGKILATTVPECDLYLDFSRVPEKDKNGKIKTDSTGRTIYRTQISDENYNKYLDSVCLVLHEAFPDSSAASFKRRIHNYRTAEKPRGCVLVKRHVPYSYWSRICRYKGWNRGVVKYVDGKSVIHYSRFKTYGNMAESVIGFNESYLKEKYNGLEGYYDSILRGQDGLVLCRRLTRGSWIPVGQGSTIYASESDSVRTDSIPGHPVINGQDIVATIDTRLQDIAHYSLEHTLRTYNSSAGCAILIEAATGDVLVCASLIRDSLGNYAEMPYRSVPISDIYEPGSIFKPVILTAMFNDASLSLDTAMLVPVGRKKFSANSKDVIDHGGQKNDMYPLWKAVAISSNVAFSELGWRFYNNRRNELFNNVASIFPFQKLNIDLVGTEYNCRTNKMTYDNDFLRFCYGYTCAVSPLRMATFYNALANKGRMVKPRFCKAIINKGTLEYLPVEVINEQICSPETATTLRDMLVGVVEGGTGDNIKNDTYSIAGKTGTAETSPGANTSNATFVGFFPADNPKYTCLVMLRDITRFGRDAAPVFQDIADCVVSLDKELDCRPTVKILAEKRKAGSDKDEELLPSVSKAPQAEVRQIYKRLGLNIGKISMQSLWCTYSNNEKTPDLPAAYIDYTPPRGQVPNCYGMTVKDALLLCRSMGIDASFEGYGKVVSQEPKARTPITKNTKVHLKLKAAK